MGDRENGEGRGERGRGDGRGEWEREIEITHSESIVGGCVFCGFI